MKKILFINHEITPYVADTELSLMGRKAPQNAQDHGSEIRTFMPKWGNVNERRNQLHEVIRLSGMWGEINERRGQLHEVQRLSGMNIVINDTDHPLIIKVASIPQTKIQVYFIDNDEYFFKNKNGEPITDNAERAIFFARGVIETMKKLRWSPDVIHCQGWMSYFAPLYIKQAYQDEPAVNNAKIVTSIFSKEPNAPFENDVKQRIAFKDITVESLEKYKDQFTLEELTRLAIDNSDGVIAASDGIDSIYKNMAEEVGAKYLDYHGEDFGDAYYKFYDSLFE